MTWMDFNSAEEQTSGDVIPHKTLARVHMKIRPGGYDDPSKGWTGGIATRSENTGAVYIDCEYTVIGGKYAKRKVWSLIGLHSPKGPKWEAMGRSFIRAALESAHGVKPDDASDKAVKARQISSLGELDGLEFAVQIDVEKAEPGSGYDDKNKINNVIPATHRDYRAIMEGEAPETAPSKAPAAQSKTASQGTPAWAQ
ncbi:MAG: hypothetical protein CMJ32_00090 [Phycisphaerae bacterium]|nr:hypothetical protein [Phycisphaerae bacterium]